MVWVSTQSSLDEKLNPSLLVKMLPVALGQAQVMRKPAKTLLIMNSEYWVLVYTQTHMTLDKLLNFRVQFPYQEKGFNSNI